MGNVNSILSSRNGSLALSICFPLGVSFFLAGLAQKDVKSWYKKLKKPSWNPPQWLFGPVWTGLYALMGISSWMIHQREGFKGKGAVALGWYAAQLVFNFAWTPLFFQAHRLDLAMADSVALLASAIATTVQFRQISPRAANLFAPVVGWVTFATVLNAWLLNNNPDAENIDYGTGDDIIVTDIPMEKHTKGPVIDATTIDPPTVVAPGTSKKLE